MISRRTFLVGSLTAVAASSLARGGGLLAHAQQKPTLRVFFVGGSAFRRSGSNCLVVQPSGKTAEGQPYKHPEHGHEMAHRSFMVVPRGLVAEAQEFERGYPSATLHPDLAAPELWRVVCLAGKDVRIGHEGGETFGFQCEEMADYHWLSAGWTLRGTWSDPAKAIGPEASSRFLLTGGLLRDGAAVNRDGYAASWVIGNGPAAKLSDVAVLTLTAPVIQIAGLSSSPLTLQQDASVYVFSGPEHHHGEEGVPFEYDRIEHALLLNTLYDTQGADVRPRTGKTIRAMGQKKQPHPCDSSRQKVAARAAFFAPPDSEYCANYNHLP